MPAAAVIPAPIAYIKVVAVKKLVVGPMTRRNGLPQGSTAQSSHYTRELLKRQGTGDYFEEIRVFKAGLCLNTLAWNNKIGLWSYFVGLRAVVMINRDSWGHLYSVVRGEILGFTEDKLMRKHLPRMFSLIKNES